MWGPSSHDWDKATNAYLKHKDLERIPYTDLIRAVESFVDEGEKWAPRIPQVLARARAGMDHRPMPTPDECRHETLVSCRM